MSKKSKQQKERATEESHPVKEKEQKKTIKKLKKYISLTPKIPSGKKIAALAIFVISLAVLITIGLFLFKDFLKAKDLSKILTAEHTVMLLELDLQDENINKLKNIDRQSLFEMSKVYEEINKLLSSDFEKDIRPWLGDKVALTLIRKDANDKSPVPLYFIEIRDRRKAMEYFEKQKLIDKEKIVEEKFLNFKIYEYQLSQNLVFTNLGRYVIAGTSKDALKLLLKNYKENPKKLETAANYVQVRNNLPVDHFASVYVDVKAAIEALRGTETIGMVPYTFIKPFLEIAPSFGAVLNLKDQGLTVSSYVVINKTVLKDQQYFTKTAKYDAELIDYVHPQSTYFLGGYDLQNQFKRLLEITKEKNVFLAPILESHLNHLKNTYLDKEISLEEDIYPIFKKEFAFSIYRDENSKNVFVFTQKLGNPQKDKQTVEKIIGSFVNKNAFFDPYVEKNIDDQGNPSPTIVNPSGLINEFKTLYQEISISTITIPGLEREISSAVYDDILIITSSQKATELTIDRLKRPENSPIKTRINSELSRKIILSSDEISYIDFLQTRYPDSEMFKTLPFAYMISGNNIFDDGMATIHYFHFAEKGMLPEKENTEKTPAAENKNDSAPPEENAGQ